jgi:hypothetical protein
MSAGETSGAKISTYYAGMHMVLCTGPIDYIGFIYVKETQINSIPIIGSGLPTDETTQGTPTYFVDLPELFGGLKREGGIRGILSFMFGYPTQTHNPYLQSQQILPCAHRGVVSVILNRMYLGTSYYLHQWRFLATRVNVREKGLAQWYPEIASPLMPLDMTHSYSHLGAEIEPQNFGLTRGVVYTGYYVIKGSSVWIVLDDTQLASAAGYNLVSNSAGVSSGGLINAVHVIRECFTDTEWGLGEAESSIDDGSFLSAATQCFNEGLGFAWLWDKSKPVDEFIAEVATHINAVVFRDRRTNKWRITLIRKVTDLTSLPRITTALVTKVNKLKRKQLHDLTSQVVLRYESNLTFKEATVRVSDPSLAARQGKERVTTLNFSGVATPEVAQVLAQRELKNLSTAIYTGSLTGARKLADLNPGDAFVLEAFGALESDLVLRVVSLELGTILKEPVTIEFTEDAFEATRSVTSFGFGSRWTPPDSTAQPIAQRKVFETPYYAVALEKGDTGAQAVPETSSFIRATAVSPAGLAVTSELWGTTGTTYTYKSLIDFQFGGQLYSATSRTASVLSVKNLVDVDNLQIGNLLYLEEELLQVIAFDLTASTITVSRGVLDTVPETHPADSWFIAVGYTNGSDPTEYIIGESPKTKLLTKTPSETLALASAAEDTITLSGRMHRPYPPGDFKINGESWLESSGFSGVYDFSWTSRNRLQQTTSVLLDYYSSSVTSEPDVSYNLRLLLDSDDTLLYSYSGSGLTKQVTFQELPSSVTFPALVRIELESENLNGVSFQTVIHKITIQPTELNFVAEDDVTNFTDADGVTIFEV